MKQIYNYRYIYQNTHKEDDYEHIWKMCLQHWKETLDLLDKKKQGFVLFLKSTLEWGKEPSIILFLNHTIVDLDRFCTMRAPFNYYSLVPTDMIYQITERCLTQTAFENLSVLRRDTLKSPWFPCLSPGYGNIAKALTDRGPYILAHPFKKFQLTYGE